MINKMKDDFWASAASFAALFKPASLMSRTFTAAIRRIAILTPVLVCIVVSFSMTGCVDGLMRDFNCTGSEDCDYWNEETASGSCFVTVVLPTGGSYSKCIQFTGSLYLKNGELVVAKCEELDNTDLTTAGLSQDECSLSDRIGICTVNADEPIETVDIFYRSDDLADAEAELLCPGEWESLTQ